MTDFATTTDIQNAITSCGVADGGQLHLHKQAVTTVAGYYYSLWFAAGTPPTGAAPTTWATPTQATAGAWNPTFVNPANSRTARILGYDAFYGTSQNLIYCDRLGHMASMSGTVLTAQTTGASLTTPAASGRCASNGSDVMWYLEWYTATGSTAVTATISYTNQAGTSGQTTTISLPASVPAYRMYPINVLASGDTSIQSVDSVTLSASTLTAGNFGVTAYKYLFMSQRYNYGGPDIKDWALTGMPVLGSNACLCPITVALGASAGSVEGFITVGTN